MTNREKLAATRRRAKERQRSESLALQGGSIGASATGAAVRTYLGEVPLLGDTGTAAVATVLSYGLSMLAKGGARAALQGAGASFAGQTVECLLAGMEGGE